MQQLFSRAMRLDACRDELPVVHRKVSGGFRLTWGAEAYATVATVLRRARKHDQDALETLTDAVGPSIEETLFLQRT